MNSQDLNLQFPGFPRLSRRRVNPTIKIRQKRNIAHHIHFVHIYTYFLTASPTKQHSGKTST